MKSLLVFFAMMCAIACTAEAQCSAGFPGQCPPKGYPPHKYPRYRRDAPEEPQGSISLQGSQPLGGRDRHPSFDLNTQHRIIDNGRTQLNEFRGANIYRGRVTPQAGVDYEHRFRNNMFINAQDKVQREHDGKLSPAFGAGWRFRREALPTKEEQNF